MIEIHPADSVDPQALLEHVVEAWSSEAVVAHDEAMYPARLPGFVALSDGKVGHISYRALGERCEITSIDAAPKHSGTGTMLLEAVIESARAAGLTTIWLTSTNDNLDAVRFLPAAWIPAVGATTGRGRPGQGDAQAGNPGGGLVRDPDEGRARLRATARGAIRNAEAAAAQRKATK